MKTIIKKVYKRPIYVITSKATISMLEHTIPRKTKVKKKQIETINTLMHNISSDLQKRKEQILKQEIKPIWKKPILNKLVRWFVILEEQKPEITYKTNIKKGNKTFLVTQKIKVSCKPEWLKNILFK